LQKLLVVINLIAGNRKEPLAEQTQRIDGIFNRFRSSALAPSENSISAVINQSIDASSLTDEQKKQSREILLTVVDKIERTAREMIQTLEEQREFLGKCGGIISANYIKMRFLSDLYPVLTEYQQDEANARKASGEQVSETNPRNTVALTAEQLSWIADRLVEAYPEPKA
jgi:hypothetical protein